MDPCVYISIATLAEMTTALASQRRDGGRGVLIGSYSRTSRSWASDSETDLTEVQHSVHIFNWLEVENDREIYDYLSRTLKVERLLAKCKQFISAEKGSSLCLVGLVKFSRLLDRPTAKDSVLTREMTTIDQMPKLLLHVKMEENMDYSIHRQRTTCLIVQPDGVWTRQNPVVTPNLGLVPDTPYLPFHNTAPLSTNTLSDGSQSNVDSSSIMESVLKKFSQKFDTKTKQLFALNSTSNV